MVLLGRVLLAAHLLLLPLGAALGQTRPYRPGVDVRRYDFRISIPDTGGTIQGRATVAFERLDARGDTLRLDLVGLTVDSVLDEAGFALRYGHDGRVVTVVFPASPSGARDRVARVAYRGAPRDGLFIGPNARGRRSAFADNWPDRARFWLPTVDHPSDKVAVTWEVEAPVGWRVVANGLLEGMDRLPSGRTRWRYREDRPIPTYTMVVGATEFTVSTLTRARSGEAVVPVEVWSYAEDSAYADSVPFRRAAEILEAMRHLVGPFPYGKLAHVQAATRFGGMENSTAIFYAEQLYVRRRMGEGVVRHETAHQWFGDAVTERDWHHLWLSEGFASYFDYVVGAALDGDSVLSAGMRANAESYLRSGVVDRPIVDTTVSEPMRLLNANNYQKGSWVLHMLRGMLGDSVFFGGIREYYRLYRDSSVLSEDFQRVMERAAGGRDLGWFFRQWLWQPGYPDLELVWSWDAASAAVRIVVRQRQSEAWGLFRLPLEVELRGASGSSSRHLVDLDGLVREWRGSLAVAERPISVAVDPDRRLLLVAVVREAAGP